MAQLKTDEWPDDGERTTTENQAGEAPAAEQLKSYGRPEPAPQTSGESADELPKAPSDAAD